jgi:hypothetical protein
MPRHSCEANPASSALTVVLPPAPLLAPEAEPDSNDRWEMVLPQMVRSGHKTFAPAGSLTPSGEVGGASPPYAPPMFTNFEAQQFLSKAFSAIGRCTRALLASPAPLADNEAVGVHQDKYAAREVFLSKIAKALHRRTPDVSLLAADRLPEVTSLKCK